MSLSANLEVTSPPQLELKMNKRKHAIKKYWEENREKILGIQKKHYQQNKEHIVEINKMHFIKVEKNELGKMENIPIIFKFKEGIHGGYVDECSSKSMKIYRIHALENGKEWIKYQPVLGTPRLVGNVLSWGVYAADVANKWHCYEGQSVYCRGINFNDQGTKKNGVATFGLSRGSELARILDPLRAAALAAVQPPLSNPLKFYELPPFARIHLKMVLRSAGQVSPNSQGKSQRSVDVVCASTRCVLDAMVFGPLAEAQEWTVRHQSLLCLNARVDVGREQIKIDEASRAVFLGISDLSMPSVLPSPVYSR